MARIAGVNLPVNKKVPFSLCYIYGVGLKTAEKICEKANVSLDARVKDLSDEAVLGLSRVVTSDFVVEGDLRRKVAMDIKRKREIRCYQGIRHEKRLPVRGQNTQKNARTRKGKSSVPIAGKKKAK